MNNQHLMVIDPAVIKPAIESYNRIALAAPFPVTYHLPALHGLTSIEQMRYCMEWCWTFMGQELSQEWHTFVRSRWEAKAKR